MGKFVFNNQTGQLEEVLPEGSSTNFGTLFREGGLDQRERLQTLPDDRIEALLGEEQPDTNAGDAARIRILSEALNRLQAGDEYSDAAATVEYLTQAVADRPEGPLYSFDEWDTLVENFGVDAARGFMERRRGALSIREAAEDRALADAEAKLEELGGRQQAILDELVYDFGPGDELEEQARALEAYDFDASLDALEQAGPGATTSEMVGFSPSNPVGISLDRTSSAFDSGAIRFEQLPGGGPGVYIDRDALGPDGVIDLYVDFLKFGQGELEQIDFSYGDPNLMERGRALATVGEDESSYTSLPMTLSPTKAQEGTYQYVGATASKEDYEALFAYETSEMLERLRAGADYQTGDQELFQLWVDDRLGNLYPEWTIENADETTSFELPPQYTQLVGDAGDAAWQLLIRRDLNRHTEREEQRNAVSQVMGLLSSGPLIFEDRQSREAIARQSEVREPFPTGAAITADLAARPQLAEASERLDREDPEEAIRSVLYSTRSRQTSSVKNSEEVISAREDLVETFVGLNDYDQEQLLANVLEELLNAPEMARGAAGRKYYVDLYKELADAAR